MKIRINGITRDMTPEEIAEYEATLPTVEELALQALEYKKKHAEQVIQSHINSFVTSKGYDNENSIAKYLVVGNPFYEECSALSLWIGAVWVKAHDVMAQVLGGTLAEPTDEELVALMPIFGE